MFGNAHERKRKFMTTAQTQVEPPQRPAPSQPAAPVPPQRAHLWTIFLGLLGLVIICPLIQWLEIGTDEANSLTSVAVPPMPILILGALVLSAALAGLIKKFSPRADFLLLYAMFMIGATICSSGVVRPVIGSMAGIADELLNIGVTTVRPGYNRQDPRFFPKLPGPLAADTSLEDDAATASRKRARQNELYAPLKNLGGLPREPRDIPPGPNHPNPRYELPSDSGYWKTMVAQVGWWWQERFKRDMFGTIKAEIQASDWVARGATTQPAGDMPGLPQSVIDGAKADPPSGLKRGFADGFLRDVEAYPERVIVDGKSLRREPATPTVPWHIWARPLFHWTVMCLLVVGFMLALAEVLRRIWLRIENLPMPLVEVPDALLSLTPGAVRAANTRALMFVGMTIGASWVSIFAAGHFQITGFESITLDYSFLNLTPALKEVPFSFIPSGMKLYYSPMLIALGCLVSLEISRSVWSIWLIICGILMVLGVLGYSGATLPRPTQLVTYSFNNFPYWDDLAAGAMVALSCWLLWASRWRLWDILTGIWHPADPGKVGEAFISPRLLPILLLGLLVAMPAYAWYMGVKSITFLVMLFGLLILFSIAAARQRAETGLPMVPGTTNLSRYNLMFGGSWLFGEPGGSLGNHFLVLGNSLLSTILPSSLETIALAQRQRVSLRRLALGMFLAAVVAFAVSMPMVLFWQYSQGGVGTAGMAFGKSRDAIWLYYRCYSGHFEWVRITASLIGLGAMLFLLQARSRVLGFPFHPIGLLLVLQMGNNGAFSRDCGVTNLIWGPMFLAWLIKGSIFKIGGTELFGRLMPLFRGIIVGHLLAIALWAILRGVVPGLTIHKSTMFFIW